MDRVVRLDERSRREWLESRPLDLEASVLVVMEMLLDLASDVAVCGVLRSAAIFRINFRLPL